jgi:hypothetical protein
MMELQYVAAMVFYYLRPSGRDAFGAPAPSVLGAARYIHGTGSR